MKRNAKVGFRKNFRLWLVLGDCLLHDRNCSVSLVQVMVESANAPRSGDAATHAADSKAETLQSNLAKLREQEVSLRDQGTFLVTR